MNRRKFIYTTSILSMGIVLSANSNFFNDKNMDSMKFYMPEESNSHKQTWMSFVANDYIWEKRQIPEVKKT